MEILSRFIPRTEGGCKPAHHDRRPRSAASAQITTGTLSGTVKDSREGSSPEPRSPHYETKQTKSARLSPRHRRIHIPERDPDIYTVEVTMAGFKTLRRNRVQVSGGDRVALGTRSSTSAVPPRHQRHRGSGAGAVAER